MTNNWYEDFFSHEYLELYLPHLGSTRTSREIEGLCNLLGKENGRSVLDLCCGHGRHSIELAKLGYTVTGQDLSEVFIDKAKLDAAQTGVEVDFIQEDMRKLPGGRTFDVIINLFNSFGYLESREEDKKVIEAVSASLRPGGIFIQEVANPFFLVRNISKSKTHQVDNGILHETRKFDPATSIYESTIKAYSDDGTKPYELYHRVRTYNPTELANMHSSAGLEVISIFGDLNSSELTLKSPHFVIMSKQVA